MKTVYLARHGHTDLPTRADGVQLLYGPNDPLSQQGIVQVDMLADLLSFGKVRFNRIESSPNLRALQTAERISLRLGIPIFRHEGLRAVDVPYYSNQPLALLEADGENVFNVHHEGNETLKEYDKRVQRTFHEITSHREDPVLIVGHGEAIKVLMHRFHHLEGPPGFGESVDYGRALGLTLDDNGRLMRFEKITDETRPGIER
ncbi:histidine phosphatase family protein [Candidatus Roizmanbacteria bacterium]|nr:histidine phosphatase family protein [Candidatus Roizmanbacteria bacterium]